MSFPPHIMAYLNSEEFKREKAEFDEWSAKIDAIADPLIDAHRGAWRKLTFTPEAMEIQAGDPEIAFQCEIDDWVIRADFSSEIGDSSWRWKKGSEEEATREWASEFFAHGIPGDPPTKAEFDRHGWIMASAIRSHVMQQMEETDPAPL